MELTLVVAADEERGRQIEEQGQVLDVEALSFCDRDVGDCLVFKTTYDSCRSLFCTERFRDLVRSDGFGGLSFGECLAGAF